MSADAEVPHQPGLRRLSGSRTLILRQTAQTSARSALVWGLVFGLYVAASALGYASSYKSPQQRAGVAAMFGGNAGFNAIIGPARQLDTVAGFTAWRSLGVLSIVGAVWGLLAGTRLVRGEEESGRMELLLAGATTRRLAAVQSLGGLAAAGVALWSVTAAVVCAVGRSGEVGFSPSASLFFALALVGSAVLFMAVGALTSQLAATRRQVTAYASAALAVFYALRLLADSDAGVGWLRWLSPLGWIEELRPLGSEQPQVLLPIGALIAVLGSATVALAGWRDLGASVVADKTSAPTRLGLLSSPLLLAVRLARATTAGWAAVVGLLGLMMGLICKTVGQALTSNAAFRSEASRLGGRGSGPKSYLAVTFLIVAVLIALISIGQLAGLREEEASGRLDQLLTRSITRRRWLGGRLALAVAIIATTSLVCGLATWVGASIQDSGVGLGDLLAASVNVMPSALFLLGVGTLAYGLQPRRAVGFAYAVLAWSFLVEILGASVRASHWVLDTSLLHHLDGVPAVAPTWSSVVSLSAAGLLSAFAGIFLFGRRDLATR